MRIVDKRLTFSPWSKKRIAEGRKICTTRGQIYNDSRVAWVVLARLGDVKEFLWDKEGCDSPEHFERIYKSCNWGNWNPDKIVAVHFGDFREDK